MDAYFDEEDETINCLYSSRKHPCYSCDLPENQSRVLATEVLYPAKHRWFRAKRMEEAHHFVRHVYKKCDKARSEVLQLTEPDLWFKSFSKQRIGDLGVALGTSMTAMLLARLLHAFTWTAPPNVWSIDLPESETSLALAKPLLAVAKPRLPANVYPA